MNVITLSQLQFAITSVYHFFFVPLTLGLSVLVAIMEAIYVKTGEEVYKQMTKFWGKLFLINFAMGVVTGIVQEFQFGMNWAEYARFIGDVFGAPLAIEALVAFFLESTFLGIWIFGWDKLSPRLHLLSIWLVAIASNLSAFWILVANSFMQHPVGFVIENGKAVMTDFAALITNPYVFGQFTHTIFSGFTTGAFFVLGISIYHLLRKHEEDLFRRSFKIASIFALVSVMLVILVGDLQTKQMVKIQPMKVAAAEGLLENEDPASLSLFTVTNVQRSEGSSPVLSNAVDIRIPYLLSILSFSSLEGEVRGLNTLQAEFTELYGEGDYVPPVFIAYWSFRIMVGAGFLMAALAVAALFFTITRRPLPNTIKGFPIGKFLPFILILPYLATTFGWILTEMGRQPWIVFGLMKTQDAVSSTLTPGMVLTTLLGFTLVYGILMVADIYLLVKYAKAGPQALTGELNS